VSPGKLSTCRGHTGRGSHSCADPSAWCSETVRHSQRQRSASVRKAVSPAVALCMRAVYAAFLWHEGVVHDAMACASFLKFHPSLPKHLPQHLRARWQTSATSSLSTDRQHGSQEPAADVYVLCTNEHSQ